MRLEEAPGVVASPAPTAFMENGDSMVAAFRNLNCRVFEFITPTIIPRRVHLSSHRSDFPRGNVGSAEGCGAGAATQLSRLRL